MHFGGNKSKPWFIWNMNRSAALVCAFCIVCRIHLFEMLRTRSVVYPVVKKCGYKTIHNFIMRYETVVLYWYNGHDYTEMWYFSLIYYKKQICGYELQKCNYIHPLFFNFNYVTITKQIIHVQLPQIAIVDTDVWVW